MIRRTFISVIAGLFGSLFVIGAHDLYKAIAQVFQPTPPLPEPTPRELINGVWEAPGFHATFTCMKCGCNHGCNNITTCQCCKSSHFAVTAVHVGMYSFHMKPPINCTLSKDAEIFVPTDNGFDCYEAGPDHRPVKTRRGCKVIGFKFGCIDKKTGLEIPPFDPKKYEWTSEKSTSGGWQYTSSFRPKD